MWNDDILDEFYCKQKGQHDAPFKTFGNWKEFGLIFGKNQFGQLKGEVKLLIWQRFSGILFDLFHTPVSVMSCLNIWSVGLSTVQIYT